MFGRLGRIVVHNPWKVIAVWVVALFAAGFAPAINDVITRDQANFLPDSYESVQAQELARQAFGQGDTTSASATIVVKRDDGQPLTDADQAKVGELARQIQSAGINKVTAVVTGPQALSPNKQVQLVNIPLQGLPDSPDVVAAVGEIRDIGRPALAGTGLTMAVTGDAALVADNQDAFDRALLIIGLATIVLIIALLLVIYRSPIAALLPILSVGLVSFVAQRLIALTAEAVDLQVDQSLPIILTIVLYGVGTDYIVFLLFRYRERLRAGDDPRPALITALQRIGEVIASAAGAIVVAFSVLLLAVFGGFRSLGPALAIAVVVMAAAALTLVPAIVSLIGTKVFWPSKSWQRTPHGTALQRLGRLTGRRPALVAAVSGGLMVALALGALGFKADYDQLSQLPEDTESAQGMKDLQAGFPAGALSPTTVYLRGDSTVDISALAPYAQRLAQIPGVGAVMPAGADGSLAALSPDRRAAQFNLLLSWGPYSAESLKLVSGELRDVAHAEAPPGTTALVGGVTAIFADIEHANNRDLRVVFPVAALLIALILAFMLRSVVAPIYLIVAVVLGFFATLGASVLVFQGIGERPGLSFMLPTILYLFVVAIGTDYNILMIARLREEAREGRQPREAADLAIEHAGPSVAAAGVILAGTFASMMLAGVAFLSEMGFAVSVGIIISAFLMSMFLVPSVTALLGHGAWWPGHGDVPTREPARDLADATARGPLAGQRPTST